MGFVAGGLPGSRLLARLAIFISDDTVLRFVKLSPVTASKDDPVRCLGGTIGRGAKVRITAPFWSISTGIALWISCRADRPMSCWNTRR